MFNDDSFVPRELVRSLLAQDAAANSNATMSCEARCNQTYARFSEAGYPSYDLLAEQLRGNRLSAVPLPGGVTAVFSASGQIGETPCVALCTAVSAGPLMRMHIAVFVSPTS